MAYINHFGQIVAQITSIEGQKEYFSHKNFRRCCCANKKESVIKPTIEEAVEYLQLYKKYACGISGNNQKEYKRYHHMKDSFDWRTQLIEENGVFGLISPPGELILPPIFQDVFTQFDAIFSVPDLIPVCNGNTWGLVIPGKEPMLVVDFKYSAIIPERWGNRIFFVQEQKTRLWGALQLDCVNSSISNKVSLQYRVQHLIELMPPIADDIYEDELYTECSPTTFWMIKRDDKVGILSYAGYSDIIYDTYECDDEHCTFRLIRNDRKRAHIRRISDPSGKY